MHTEPIRWAVITAAVLSALSVSFITLADTGDWRQAAIAAVVAFALPTVGGEVARTRAYAPATVADLSPDTTTDDGADR